MFVTVPMFSVLQSRYSLYFGQSENSSLPDLLSFILTPNIRELTLVL